MAAHYRRPMPTDRTSRRPSNRAYSPAAGDAMLAIRRVKLRDLEAWVARQAEASRAADKWVGTLPTTSYSERWS